MTRWILEMTCQIIVIYICLVIYFCHIHNSFYITLLLLSWSIDEVLSGLIYFLTRKKYLFALTFYAILFFLDTIIHTLLYYLFIFWCSKLPSSFPTLLPFVKGGELDSWIQRNLGGTEIFQNQVGEKKRGKRGVFGIFIGGGFLEMKLQAENKISE